MEINLIMEALAKAQGSYKKLISNEHSASGKYANLQAILEAVRESLSTNGIAFYQFIELNEDQTILKTVLAHLSGQSIWSTARIVTGKNLRATANILEINKRIQALMILGIAPSQNDAYAFDDNTDELSEQQLIEEVRKPKDGKAKLLVDRETTINKDQYQELLIELDGYESICEDILECYKIETLADLPKEEYHKAKNKIFKIKKIHEDYSNRAK